MRCSAAVVKQTFWKFSEKEDLSERPLGKYNDDNEGSSQA